MSASSVRWSATLLKQLPTVRNKASALRCFRTLTRVGGPSILDAQKVFTGPYATRKLRRCPVQSRLAEKKVGGHEVPLNGQKSLRKTMAGYYALCAFRDRTGIAAGPAASWIAPSTPPPPSKERLAALTITSTFSLVMSPCLIVIFVCILLPLVEHVEM
jgi:hypothetical protein